jgi:hypothetical protein
MQKTKLVRGALSRDLGTPVDVAISIEEQDKILGIIHDKYDGE